MPNKATDAQVDAIARGQYILFRDRESWEVKGYLPYPLDRELAENLAEEHKVKRVYPLDSRWVNALLAPSEHRDPSDIGLLNGWFMSQGMDPTSVRTFPPASAERVKELSVIGGVDHAQAFASMVDFLRNPTPPSDLDLVFQWYMKLSGEYPPFIARRLVAAKAVTPDALIKMTLSWEGKLVVRGRKIREALNYPDWVFSDPQDDLLSDTMNGLPYASIGADGALTVGKASDLLVEKPVQDLIAKFWSSIEDNGFVSDAELGVNLPGWEIPHGMTLNFLLALQRQGVLEPGSKALNTGDKSYLHFLERPTGNSIEAAAKALGDDHSLKRSLAILLAHLERNNGDAHFLLRWAYLRRPRHVIDTLVDNGDLRRVLVRDGLMYLQECDNLDLVSYAKEMQKKYRQLHRVAQHRFRKLTQPRWIIDNGALVLCPGLSEKEALLILQVLGLEGESDLITEENIIGCLNHPVSDLTPIHALIEESAVENREESFKRFVRSPDNVIGLYQPKEEDWEATKSLAKEPKHGKLDLKWSLAAALRRTLLDENAPSQARRVMESVAPSMFDDAAEILGFLVNEMGTTGILAARPLEDSTQPQIVAVGQKLIQKMMTTQKDGVLEKHQSLLKDLMSPKWAIVGDAPDLARYPGVSEKLATRVVHLAHEFSGEALDNEIRRVIDEHLENGGDPAELYSMAVSLSRENVVYGMGFLCDPTRAMWKSGLGDLILHGSLPTPAQADIDLAHEMTLRYRDIEIGGWEPDAEFLAHFLAYLRHGPRQPTSWKRFQKPHPAVDLARIIKESMRLEDGVKSTLLAIRELHLRREHSRSWRYLDTTLAEMADYLLCVDITDEYLREVGRTFQKLQEYGVETILDVVEKKLRAAAGPLPTSTPASKEPKILADRNDQDSAYNKALRGLYSEVGREMAKNPDVAKALRDATSTWVSEKVPNPKIAVLAEQLTHPVTLLTSYGFAKTNLEPKAAAFKAQELFQRFGFSQKIPNQDLWIWLSEDKDVSENAIALLCLARDGYLSEGWQDYVKYVSPYIETLIRTTPAILPRAKVMDLQAMRSLFQEHGLDASMEEFGVDLTVYLRGAESRGEPIYLGSVLQGGNQELKLKATTLIVGEMIRHGGIETSRLEESIKHLLEHKEEAFRNAGAEIQNEVLRSQTRTEVAQEAISGREHPHVAQAEESNPTWVMDSFGLRTIPADEPFSSSTQVLKITQDDIVFTMSAIPNELQGHPVAHAMACYLRGCWSRNESPSFAQLLRNDIHEHDRFKVVLALTREGMKRGLVSSDRVMTEAKQLMESPNVKMFNLGSVLQDAAKGEMSATKAQEAPKEAPEDATTNVGRCMSVALKPLTYIRHDGAKLVVAFHVPQKTAVVQRVLESVFSTGDLTPEVVRQRLWSFLQREKDVDSVFIALLSLVRCGFYPVSELASVEILSPAMGDLIHSLAWCPSTTHPHPDVADIILDLLAPYTESEWRINVVAYLIQMVGYMREQVEPMAGSTVYDLCDPLWAHDAAFPGLVERVFDVLAREKYISTDTLHRMRLDSDRLKGLGDGRQKKIKELLQHLEEREGATTYSPRVEQRLINLMRQPRWWMSRKDGAHAGYRKSVEIPSEKVCREILSQMPRVGTLREFSGTQHWRRLDYLVRGLHKMDLSVPAMETLLVNLQAEGFLQFSDLPKGVSYTVDQVTASIGGWFSAFSPEVEQFVKRAFAKLKLPKTTGYLEAVTSHLMMERNTAFGGGLARVVSQALLTPTDVSGLNESDQQDGVLALVQESRNQGWFSDAQLTEAASSLGEFPGAAKLLQAMATTRPDPIESDKPALKSNGFLAVEGDGAGSYFAPGMEAQEFASQVALAGKESSFTFVRRASEIYAHRREFFQEVLKILENMEFPETPKVSNFYYHNQEGTEIILQSRRSLDTPFQGQNLKFLVQAVCDFSVKERISLVKSLVAAQLVPPGAHQLLVQVLENENMTNTSPALTALEYLNRPLGEVADMLRQEVSKGIISEDYACQVRGHLIDNDFFQRSLEHAVCVAIHTTVGMKDTQAVRDGAIESATSFLKNALPEVAYSPVNIGMATDVANLYERYYRSIHNQYQRAVFARGVMDPHQSYNRVSEAENARLSAVFDDGVSKATEKVNQTLKERINSVFQSSQPSVMNPAFTATTGVVSGTELRADTATGTTAGTEALVTDGTGSDQKRTGMPAGRIESLFSGGPTQGGESMKYDSARLVERIKASKEDLRSSRSEDVANQFRNAYGGVAAGLPVAVAAKAAKEMASFVFKSQKQNVNQGKAGKGKMSSKAAVKQSVREVEEEESAEMDEDEEEDLPRRNLGDILLATVKEDAKTIGLRTGVRETREKLTELVTNFVNGKTIRRFEGETDEVYAARVAVQRNGVTAFFLSDIGQQAITYLLGLSFPVLEEHIPDRSVRKYGGMIAKEMRAQSGSELLQDFLEEVVYPLIGLLTTEAKNFGKMVLAPARRERVRVNHEFSNVDAERAALMERLAELDRDPASVTATKAR